VANCISKFDIYNRSSGFTFWEGIADRKFFNDHRSSSDTYRKILLIVETDSLITWYLDIVCEKDED